MEDIKKNIEGVRAKISEAAGAAGRDGDEVILVAVSKTRDPEEINTAIDAGITDIGEGAFKAKSNALHIYYDGDVLDANVFASSAYTVYVHTGATIDHPRTGVEKVAVTPAFYFTYTVFNGREVEITGLKGAGLSEKNVVIPTYLKGRKVTSIGDGAFAKSIPVSSFMQSVPQSVPCAQPGAYSHSIVAPRSRMR